MSSYYRGRGARLYNARWRTFIQGTLAQTLAMIDFAALCHIAMHRSAPVRVLDVACGTGRLLQHILERLPTAEVYGIDASPDMLAQAQIALNQYPHVHLHQVMLGSSRLCDLPFAVQRFDLITCTNALHNFVDPVAVLRDLKTFLSPDAHLLLEDYARRTPPFPWFVMEWLAKCLDKGHVRSYTSEEARSICQQAGFQVLAERSFRVNWLWHGWVFRLAAV